MNSSYSGYEMLLLYFFYATGAFVAGLAAAMGMPNNLSVIRRAFWVLLVLLWPLTLVSIIAMVFGKSAFAVVRWLVQVGKGGICMRNGHFFRQCCASAEWANRQSEALNRARLRMSEECPAVNLSMVQDELQISSRTAPEQVARAKEILKEEGVLL